MTSEALTASVRRIRHGRAAPKKFRIRAGRAPWISKAFLQPLRHSVLLCKAARSVDNQVDGKVENIVLGSTRPRDHDEKACGV